MCSTWDTGCCRPPTPASSPSRSRWCTRCESAYPPAIALSAAAFRASWPPTGCASPRDRTRRSRCSTPPTGSAGCCAPNASAVSRSDVGAEAFIARRPEVPALLAELGLAGTADRHDGRAAPDLQRGSAAPDAAGHAAGHPSARVVARRAGRRCDARAHRRRTLAAVRVAHGADPTVAELVGDRFGEQVVTRSVDPLLAGVYAGSSATIGLRSALPTLAAALDRGRAASPTPCARCSRRRRAGRCSAPSTAATRVLIDALVRRAAFDWAQVAVQRSTGRRRAGTLIDDEGAQLARRRGGARRARAAAAAADRGRRTRVPRRPPAASGSHRRRWWCWPCLAARRCRSTRGCWSPAAKRCTPRR